MTLDAQHFKDLLLKEAGVLETELASIGRKNPDQKGDWEAVGTDLDEDNADEFDVADDLEQFENNKAELNELEIQLNNVKNAIKKIEDGKYGLCEVCGKPIELDRLEANPSAKTDKEHMNG
ncbi:MAG: TraR/DksA C4-type zinc finger protein [Candidatus Zambryskibacteria bacterium]|nr:TraR/DksA C4-type zinc finger protein [Candidatus Zambryskibacteria bacterium]